MRNGKAHTKAGIRSANIFILAWSNGDWPHFVQTNPQRGQRTIEILSPLLTGQTERHGFISNASLR